MRLTIASGKGGTGKTLIATSLARLWADKCQAVTYVDADAEEPNGHLFLKPTIESEQRFSVKVPTLDGKTCNAHGACQEICAFNAILATKGSIIVFDELCHNCGACLLACPDNALTEVERSIGSITKGVADGVIFFGGKLDIGQARVTPLIDGLIDQVLKDPVSKNRRVIIDSPPGTSCSAMAAAQKADLVLLVTEPTPFGLHDLKLAIDMGRALGRPLASIINRYDLGGGDVRRLLDAESVPVLAEIPFDRAVAQSYAVSNVPLYHSKFFKEKIIDVADKLELFQEGSEQ